MSVAAVVPTTGKREALGRCVRSLLGQTHSLSEVVIVVDGAQQHELQELARDSVPCVKIIASPLPGSFSAAANAGIRATSSDWVLLVNDDVILAPDCLKRLLDGLPHDPRVGMVCGRLRSADGTRIDSTGQFRRRSWTARERGHGEMDCGQYSSAGYVESVCAAAGLYRRAMLDEIAEDGQYFDEDFGVFLEDIDLGLRAQRSGWRAYYVPDAVGIHIRGATTKSQSVPRWLPLKSYYLPQLPTPLLAQYVLNRYRLIRRHGRFGRLLGDFPWLLGYELCLWSYLVICRPVAIRAIASKRQMGI